MNDKYDWAIVSDNLSLTLFVLARNVTDFKLKYEKAVLKLLWKQQFYLPLPTYQKNDCVYSN